MVYHPETFFARTDKSIPLHARVLDELTPLLGRGGVENILVAPTPSGSLEIVVYGSPREELPIGSILERYGIPGSVIIQNPEQPTPYPHATAPINLRERSQLTEQARHASSDDPLGQRGPTY